MVLEGNKVRIYVAYVIEAYKPPYTLGEVIAYPKKTKFALTNKKNIMYRWNTKKDENEAVAKVIGIGDFLVDNPETEEEEKEMNDKLEVMIDERLDSLGIQKLR